MRRSLSSQSFTPPRGSIVLQLAVVGVIDLVLILAMLHPSLTRSLLASMPMATTVPTATISPTTSGGKA